MNSHVINEEFTELEDFALGIPRNFDLVGEIIQDNRNVIKKVETSQGTFVVKNFKGMYFFNRLAYSIFRKSKAERSYAYSLLLRSKGVLTPPPIAWIDCYRWGLLTHSYFISVFYSYRTLSDITRQLDLNEYKSRVLLYGCLARFAFTLHRLGIYHDDFSSGNILVIENHDHYTFALVDLNRIKFQKVNYRKGLQNFAKLGIPREDLNMLIQAYAIQAGQPIADSIDTFWADRKRSKFIQRIRKTIRKYTLTSLEKIVTGRRFVL